MPTCQGDPRPSAVELSRQARGTVFKSCSVSLGSRACWPRPPGLAGLATQPRRAPQGSPRLRTSVMHAQSASAFRPIAACSSPSPQPAQSPAHRTTARGRLAARQRQPHRPPGGAVAARCKSAPVGPFASHTIAHPFAMWARRACHVESCTLAGSPGRVMHCVAPRLLAADCWLLCESARVRQACGACARVWRSQRMKRAFFLHFHPPTHRGRASRPAAPVLRASTARRHPRSPPCADRRDRDAIEAGRRTPRSLRAHSGAQMQKAGYMHVRACACV